MSKIQRGSALFAIILLFGAVSPAFSKDLNVLIRMLYAAFVAEDGATMCAVPSVQLSDEDRIVFRDARNYAQWIKQRISADLSADDVRFILQSAADKAKGEMDEVVRVLKSYPPDAEHAELSRWCTGKMKAIAFQVVGTYVNQRETIERLIEKSKQD